MKTNERKGQKYEIVRMKTKKSIKTKKNKRNKKLKKIQTTTKHPEYKRMAQQINKSTTLGSKAVVTRGGQ